MIYMIRTGRNPGCVEGQLAPKKGISLEEVVSCMGVDWKEPVERREGIILQHSGFGNDDSDIRIEDQGREWFGVAIYDDVGNYVVGVR